MTPEERAEAFIGQRFGYLVVTGVVGLRAPRGGKKKMMYVTCDCDCGRKDHIIMLDSIRYGKSYSCGCARSLHDRPSIFGGHLASPRPKKPKLSKPIVNSIPIYQTEVKKEIEGLGISLSVSRISHIWNSLQKDQLCLAWQDVKKFAEWAIRNGFTKDRDLKRRDQSKLYSPINAYWG